MPRGHKTGSFVFTNSSTPGSAIDKIRRDTEDTVIVMSLIPSTINSFLFVEASIDGASWAQCLDQDGTLVYLDCSGLTSDFWWTVKADVMPAYYLRLASYTNANGTAGSAISGTVSWMGASN